MNARSEEGQLAKQILIDFMADFQSRNPNLHVFSAHLHMDEETPHIHIDFVPVITGSKRGLDTRVSLKQRQKWKRIQGSRSRYQRSNRMEPVDRIREKGTGGGHGTIWC